MSEESPDIVSDETLPDRIRFDQIKSSMFRVVHVDGAFGGPTPNGYIHMAMFNERLAIPKQVVHAVETDGSLGAEIVSDREVRRAVVRELEFDCIMSIETAVAIQTWLAQNIVKARKLKSAAAEEREA